MDDVVEVVEEIEADEVDEVDEVGDEEVVECVVRKEVVASEYAGSCSVSNWIYFSNTNASYEGGYSAKGMLSI